MVKGPKAFPRRYTLKQENSKAGKTSVCLGELIYTLQAYRGELKERGLIREGSLLLNQTRNFMQMFFCIPSAFFPLKRSVLSNSKVTYN